MCLFVVQIASVYLCYGGGGKNGKIKVGGKTHRQGHLVKYFQRRGKPHTFKKTKKTINHYNADRGNTELVHARALVKQQCTSEFTHVPAAPRGRQMLSEPEDGSVNTDDADCLPLWGLPAVVCEV